MSRLTFPQVASGLDQLYQMPLLEVETIHDRMHAIEAFLNGANWSWDQVIEEMAKPEVLPIYN
jgi:hypothetical protein